MTYDFYIKLKNGAPFEHPIAVDNLARAYPHVDLTSLPEWLAPFVRHEKPTPNFLEIVEGPVYQIIDGVVHDVWTVIAMTPEEKSAKIAEIRKEMVENNFSSWVLNEETGEAECPVPHPLDGNKYKWDDVNVQWVQVS